MTRKNLNGQGPGQNSVQVSPRKGSMVANRDASPNRRAQVNQPGNQANVEMKDEFKMPEPIKRPQFNSVRKPSQGRNNMNKVINQ